VIRVLTLVFGHSPTPPHTQTTCTIRESSFFVTSDVNVSSRLRLVPVTHYKINLKHFDAELGAVSTHAFSVGHELHHLG